MDWRAIVGGNVRRWRLERGLTQEQLAFEAQIDLTYLGGIADGTQASWLSPESTSPLRFGWQILWRNQLAKSVS